MLIPVSLAQIKRGARAGVERQLSAIELDREKTTSRTPFRIHILGAIAELVVCEYFGFEWDATIGVVQKNDMSGAKKPVDIKTNTSLIFSDCLFHPTKNDMSGFVFIFSGYKGGNELDLWGWIESEEYFKQAGEPKQLIAGRGDCFLMDKKHLTPFKKPRS
jgi:hypothetical protein